MFSESLKTQIVYIAPETDFIHLLILVMYKDFLSLFNKNASKYFYIMWSENYTKETRSRLTATTITVAMTNYYGYSRQTNGKRWRTYALIKNKRNYQYD